MQDLSEPIRILKEGGIVIYPTDTAYGIGCRIDDLLAVKRLFKIRKRPENQAVPVLVSSIEMAKKYYRSPLSDVVRHLMEDKWPGALTIVNFCQDANKYPLVCGGGNTIGIRMPNHEIALELIRSVGVAILGPSANFHGLPTPYLHETIDNALAGKADYCVKGTCRLKQASTVADCSRSPYQIVRQGAVELETYKYEK